jgi:hypothetical protein
LDQFLHSGIRLMVCQQSGEYLTKCKLSRALIFLPGMTGRALLIGTLLIGLGLAGVARRVIAQTDIESEDLSTGEISEESSSIDFDSDEISSDDHLPDDPFSSDKGTKGIARPPQPERPDY